MLDEKHKLRRQTSIASIFVLLLFALSIVAAVPPVQATHAYTPATLSLGGSTLLAPLMTVWQNQFHTFTHGAVSISYQPVGSTSGTNNMLSDIFSVGFSDAPIPANGLATLNGMGDVTSPANSPPAAGLAGKDPLLQIADGLAPVAIFYNIPGYRGTLNLTGYIVGQIYLQKITKWTDPTILAINHGLTPAQITSLGKYPINPVHRSDGSGTSFALTTYFGRVDPNWVKAGFKPGSTSASNFPVGELSAKGSGGVAGLVAATNGAIGYGETAYAIGAGLVYAAIQNSAGKFVLPLPAGATAAAAADASLLKTNPEYVIVDAPGKASYAISTLTYAFVWENQNLGTSGGSTWTYGLAYDTVQFLNYIVTQGQSYATTLSYAPLPASLVTLDLTLIAKINYGGTFFLTPTTTTMTCVPTSVIVGRVVSCTARLGGSGFTGAFQLSSTAAGTFSRPVCTTLPACVSSFTTQGTGSPETINAVYTGDLNHAPSIGTFSLTVKPAASTTTLSCSEKSPKITCKVTVIGFEPYGTVSISQTAGTGAISSGGSCLLAPVGSSTTTSSCSVILHKATAGPVTLLASYPGDTNNLASSRTLIFHIT